jgi:hypothetical protein
MTNEEYRIQAMNWFNDNAVHFTFLDKWYFENLFDKTFLLIPLVAWFLAINIVLICFFYVKIDRFTNKKFNWENSIFRYITISLLLSIFGITLITGILASCTVAETLYLSESEFYKNLPAYERTKLDNSLDQYFAQFVYKEPPTSQRFTQISITQFKDIIFDIFPVKEEIVLTKEEILRERNYERLQKIRFGF